MIVMQLEQRTGASPILTTRRSLLALSGLGALAVGLAACGGKDGSSGGSGKPQVIVGCYGVQYMAQLVAGDAAEVVNLAKPGQEPHDIELSVAETAKVADADVIVRIPGFQSALDDVIDSKKLKDSVLDVSTIVDLMPAGAEEEHDQEAEASDAGGEHEHEHRSFDPHFWNDPTLLAKVATALGDKLGAAAPDAKDTFTANAKKAVETLTALDAELKNAYDAVSDPKVFVTGHTAFAYLAKRYGLEQIGITGIDPEVEPSPQRLLKLKETIGDRHITTVFFEESASPKVAQTLADNVGVTAESLDNLETQLDAKKDYPAVMREDAQKLIASWS